jgi:hypothetical protein
MFPAAENNKHEMPLATTKTKRPQIFHNQVLTLYTLYSTTWAGHDVQYYTETWEFITKTVFKKKIRAYKNKY